jgi:hypothetical protein
MPNIFPSSEIGRELRNQDGLNFIEFVIVIEYEHLFTNEVNSSIEMYLRTSLRTSRPIFEPGNE